MGAGKSKTNKIEVDKEPVKDLDVPQNGSTSYEVLINEYQNHCITLEAKKRQAEERIAAAREVARSSTLLLDGHRQRMQEHVAKRKENEGEPKRGRRKEGKDEWERKRGKRAKGSLKEMKVI